MFKEIKHDTHCRECGEQLFSFPAEAENIKVWWVDSMGGATDQLSSPYNGKGERNYAEVFQCPNFKKRFLLGGNKHTQFAIFENEVIYIEVIKKN
jgi:hypothetical protein